MIVLEKSKDTEKEDFNIILNDTKEKFLKDFEKNYSEKFIEEYNLKNFNLDLYCANFVAGNVLFLLSFTIYASSLPSISHISNINTAILIFLFIGATTSHILPFFKSIKKMLNRISMKNPKKVEEMKTQIFYNNIPDNYFFKEFINEYGEKSIKEILMDKENITYGDIIKYVKDSKTKDMKNESQQHRIQKVEDIVKCISSLK